MKMKQMTVKDHLEISKKLHEIMNTYRDIHDILEKSYVKSNPIMKYLTNLFHFGSGEKNFSKLKSHLDNEWFKVATEDDFKKYGYAYYDKRSWS